jgi:hypothetical protein
VNGELIRLAERLIAISSEESVIRGEMLRILTANGHDEEAEEVSAERHLARPNGAGPAAKTTNQQRLEAAARAEEQMLALLSQNQRMRPAALAKAMNAKVVTTADRLRRMEQRGLVRREGKGAGWSAVAQPQMS